MEGHRDAGRCRIRVYAGHWDQHDCSTRLVPKNNISEGNEETSGTKATWDHSPWKCFAKTGQEWVQQPAYTPRHKMLSSRNLRSHYVADLLPLPWSRQYGYKLCLKTRRQSVWKTELPALFTGVGNIQSFYTLPLNGGFSPHAVASPRCLALPLRGRVKEELENLQQLGPRSPMCIHMQKDHIHLLKIPWSMSEFGGL